MEKDVSVQDVPFNRKRRLLLLVFGAAGAGFLQMDEMVQPRLCLGDEKVKEKLILKKKRYYSILLCRG